MSPHLPNTPCKTNSSAGADGPPARVRRCTWAIHQNARRGHHPLASLRSVMRWTWNPSRPRSEPEPSGPQNYKWVEKGHAVCLIRSQRLPECISPHVSLSEPGHVLCSDSQCGVADRHNSSVMNACVEAPAHCLICLFLLPCCGFFFFLLECLHRRHASFSDSKPNLCLGTVSK